MTSYEFAVLKYIVSQVSEERKRRLYVFLSRTPVLALLLKSYIQRISPVWHVSYKKTGRTWLRVMLGKALQLHLGIDESEDILLRFRKNRSFHFSGISFLHDDAAHWKKPCELGASKEHFKFKKVIFQVRDPRDVVVSLFFEKTKRLTAYIDGEKLWYPDFIDRIYPYERDLSCFIREPVGSFDTIIQFYNIWAQHRELLGNSMLFVCYEDMQKDARNELRRILEFIGIEDVRSDIIDESVEYASFQKMQKRERNRSAESIKLKAVNVNDKETYKTRKGKVGGYLDYLSALDIRYLNEKMEKELSDFYNYRTQ